MFEAEAKRQLNLIPRIEKIHVEYQGQPENATLILNKVSETHSLMGQSYENGDTFVLLVSLII